MTTSIVIKNTSMGNTLRIRMQDYDPKHSKWNDAKVDGFIPPNQSLEVWVKDKTRRALIEELPT